MPDEIPPPQDTVPEKNSKGKATLQMEAAAIAEKRAEERFEKERERDKEQEAKQEKWAERALEEANRRADDAKAELDRKDKNWKEALGGKDKQIKFQWLIIGLLTLTVIGLAGYRVAGNLLGLGEVEIGHADKVEITNP